MLCQLLRESLTRLNRPVYARTWIAASPAKMSLNRKRWRLWCEGCALLIILAAAAYLRLFNVALTPGWYTDEGTHLEIARHLTAGRVQYFAITQSTLLFAKLPLFELAFALVLRLGGDGMGALRSLTGALGVLTTALLYGVARRATTRPALALLAALLYALYPDAILYSRFGFSYNLLAPLGLLAGWGLWEYLEHGARRWLALAAVALGLGLITEVWTLAWIPLFVLIAAWRRWQALLWALPLLGLPALLYAGALLLSAPQAFIFDLGFTLFRLNALPLGAQIATLARNLAALFFRDFWLALAIVGLLMLRPGRFQRLALLWLLFPIVVLGRTVSLYLLSFYYMIPLLPWIALGAAAALDAGLPYLAHLLADWSAAIIARCGMRVTFLWSVIGWALALMLVASPLLVVTIDNVAHLRAGSIRTEIDPFLLSPADARAAATFVNAHAAPDDVAIASPALAWQLTLRVADFQMPVAFDEQHTPHLPANVPPERWAFDPRYETARWIIVDNLWRGWGAANVPGLAAQIAEVESSWPCRFRSGEIVIYENPALP